MISDSTISASSGSLTTGINPDDSIKAVVKFLEERFNEFASNGNNLSVLNEKGLTQKLLIFLNRKAKNQPFFFHSEFMEDTASGRSPQVDIGTIAEDEKIIISDREYGEEDSFFSIEAKRLPTVGSNREKEYVIGHSKPVGGMERFKKGIHGSKLKYSAIIGFVQKENFDHWFLKINTWIEDLANDRKSPIWKKSDKLKRTEIGGNPTILNLFSKNARYLNKKYKDDINLFHFWIHLVDPNTTI